MVIWEHANVCSLSCLRNGINLEQEWVYTLWVKKKISGLFGYCWHSVTGVICVILKVKLEYCKSHIMNPVS